MNPISNAVRMGLARGRTELRQSLTNGMDLWGYFFPSLALLTVMVFMRGAEVPGMNFSLGSLTLPSVLGMNIVFGGMMGVSSWLAMEREDGTLLRAKATPNGMLAYLIGKSTSVSGMAVISMLFVLIPGIFLFDGLELTKIGSWLTLVWVLVLGLAATMPLGAIFGSLIPNPRNLGFVMLPFMAITAISGIFYPITGMPEWLQWIGQIFPVYWLGLGMRSALLPDQLAAVELTESWRHLETIGVLGLWAAAGLLIAPAVLRRMARKESGSAVEARRAKAIQRVN